MREKKEVKLKGKERELSDEEMMNKAHAEPRNQSRSFHKANQNCLRA